MGGLSPATLVRRKAGAPAGAEQEAGAPAGAEQEAGAPAAGSDEAEVQEEPQDEPDEGIHELVSSEDGDERMAYEPPDPSEPRCPSGDSSSDAEDETESPLKREGGGALSQTQSEQGPPLKSN